jgi:flagellar motor protein MotB
MKQLLLPALLLAIAVSACVPRDQYAALETERNYYRNMTTMADSLADQRAISSYDEVDVSGNEINQRIRQVEGLTATNLALNNSYQSLQERYDQLLSQSQELLSQSGTEVSGLQQSLAERTALVSQREAELRQLELDLQSREAAIDRIEQDYTPAGGDGPSSYGGGVNAPQAYGTRSGEAARPELTASQNAALRINEIQSQLSQLLANYPATTYRLDNEAPDQLRVTLNESILFNDGFSISSNGQNLLRGIAGVLRGQASADALIIGHTDNSNGNPLRAYEDSSDKAINVAQQLITYGMSPRKLTIGGKGFYDPVSNGITQRDLEANRRTEILVSVFEY